MTPGYIARSNGPEFGLKAIIIRRELFDLYEGALFGSAAS